MLRFTDTRYVFSQMYFTFVLTFGSLSTLCNILTFTFVVWIVNRVEQILLQNSRKALKANEHSLGDINRVNIATSDGFLLFTRLLKALPYNSMTSNENAHTHRTKVQQSHSIENAHICGGRPQSWASGEISKLKNTRTASGPPPKFSLQTKTYSWGKQHLHILNTNLNNHQVCFQITKENRD